MSVTSTRRLRTGDTRSSVRYQLYGTFGSEKYRGHMANGTTRVAAMACDSETPEAFAARAEMLARRNSRDVEARSLVQSYGLEDLDPNKPEDIQTANDLGYLLGKELAPQSDVLVVTHIDGVSGLVHNHITIVNHVNKTKKALRVDGRPGHLRMLNDQLMREFGMSVVVPQYVLDRGKQWAERRENAKLSEFEVQLGDNIMEALADERSVDTETFREVLAERGVTFVDEPRKIAAGKGKPARESIGRTYLAVDETEANRKEDGSLRRRVPRRKAASKVDDRVTAEGSLQVFQDKQKLLQLQVQSQTQKAQQQARVRQAALQTYEDSQVKAQGAGAVSVPGGSPRTAAVGVPVIVTDASDDPRVRELMDRREYLEAARMQKAIEAGTAPAHAPSVDQRPAEAATPRVETPAELASVETLAESAPVETPVQKAQETPAREQRAPAQPEAPAAVETAPAGRAAPPVAEGPVRADDPHREEREQRLARMIAATRNKGNEQGARTLEQLRDWMPDAERRMTRRAQLLEQGTAPREMPRDARLVEAEVPKHLGTQSEVGKLAKAVPMTRELREELDKRADRHAEFTQTDRMVSQVRESARGRAGRASVSDQRLLSLWEGRRAKVYDRIQAGDYEPAQRERGAPTPSGGDQDRAKARSARERVNAKLAAEKDRDEGRDLFG